MKKWPVGGSGDPDFDVRSGRLGDFVVVAAGAGDLRGTGADEFGELAAEFGSPFRRDLVFCQTNKPN